MTDQNKNLMLRLVTAFLLLPLVLWLIALGGLWFALLIAVAAGLTALEVNQMAAAAPSGAATSTPPAASASASGAAAAAAPAGSSRLGAGALASALVAFLIPLLNFLPQLSWLPLTLRSLLIALALLCLVEGLLLYEFF